MTKRQVGRNHRAAGSVMEGMKRNVVVAMALLAPLALVTAGSRPAGAADTLRERSDVVLDPAGGKVLEVENPRGSIEVRRSADGRVHLVAVKIVHGQNRRHSTQTAGQVEVTTDRIEGRYVVSVSYPQRTDVRIGFWDLLCGVEFPRAQVRLEIEAPAALPLRLRSASGDLSSEDRTGPQTIDTRSGDVSVRGARGELEVTTTSGDLSAADIGAARLRTSSGEVTVEGVHGALSVRTTSGDITVKGALDSLQLEASSGDIHVGTAPRGLRAETTSGDIDAPDIGGWAFLRSSSGDIGFGLRGPLRGAEISSVNGTVNARLAGGSGYDLDARTTNGTIDVSVPLTLSTVDRHAVTGKVAGGGAPVALRTSSGDISVVSGGK